MKYRKILTSSWKLFWGNKILLAIICLNIISGSLLPYYAKRSQLFQNLLSFSVDLAFIGFIVLVNIVFIETTLDLKRKTSVSLIGLVRNSFRFFWRTLGLTFLSTAPLALLAYFWIIYTVTNGDPNTLLWLIPLSILLIPLAFFTLLITYLAIVAVVSEDRGIREAISRSWKIVQESKAAFLRLGIILIVGNLMVSNFLNYGREQIESQFSGSAGDPVFIFLTISIWIVYILMYAVLSGFIQVNWTLAYLGSSKTKR